MELGVIETREKALNWRAIVRPYERSSNARAAFQLLVTWVPLAALFWVMYKVLSTSPWLTVFGPPAMF